MNFQIIPQLKKCTKCKEIKQLTLFGKATRSKDGYKSQCLMCKKKYREKNKIQISEAKKEYYKNNSDFVKQNAREYVSTINKAELAEKNKKYRAKNMATLKVKSKTYRVENKEILADKARIRWEENKEKLTLKNRLRWEENKEKYNKVQKENYKQNKTSILKRNKKYKQTEKGKLSVFIANKKRRVLRVSTEDGTITSKSLITLKILQNNKCAYCKYELIIGQIHLDHVIPISRGGIHSLNNVVWSCSTCNMKKHMQTGKEFMHKNHNP